MNGEYGGLSVFVSVGGRTFRPEELNILSIEIHDVDEGDNEVEIECVDNEYKIADSSFFRVGQVLSVKWGYNTKDFAEERTGYVIMKPATEYGKDGVMSKIKATTKSATLAAKHPQKTYGATSVRTIVSEIAQRSGLKLDLKGGNERLNGFSQANMSDREVLRVLADRYGYQVSYTSETIVFAPIDYGKTPELDLIFAKGEEGNILSASLNVDAKKHGGDVSTAVTTFDPKKKQAKTVSGGDGQKALAVSADNGNTWQTTIKGAVDTPKPEDSSWMDKFAGSQMKSMLPAGTEVPSGDGLDPGDVKTLLSTPDTVAGNAEAHATSEKLRRQKKKGEFSIKTLGIPSAKARMIAHVSGVAKRDSGNWYVQSVTHKIDKNGYECDFELSRHGSNSQGGQKNKPPVNNQVPNKNGANASKEVFAVDASTGATGRRKE